MYIIWKSGTGGWLTGAGTYTSVLKDARRFERDDALALAKRHYNNGLSEFGLIPVALEDLEELK